MIQVGLIVNTPVLDHLIISEKTFLSFRDIGLMEELGRSLKYVAPYLLQQRILKNKENEVKNRIARNLKEKGISVEDIAVVTGLTIRQVEKLRANC